MDLAAETHFVVPSGIDDPTHPSGGNRYDRRVVDSMLGLGRSVHEHLLVETEDLRVVLAGLPDGAVVVVDGLIASTAPDALVPAAERLRIVVLLHMPLAEAIPNESVRLAERAVLTAAAGVVTTSDWARSWVVEHHGLAPAKVWVATPGVDPAPAAWPFPPGGRLLCLAPVTRAKGHDTLLAALAQLEDLDWVCTCIGALDLEPSFVDDLTVVAEQAGIGDRLELTGPLTGPALRAALADADLLVSASRRESYGMAVAEALSHGVPVVVTDVGGHAEAVGRLPDGSPAGVLLPPDDPDALAAELRLWLCDHEERRRLRAAATERRTTLGSWAVTARRLANALDAVAMNPIAARPVSPHTTPA